MRGRWAPVRGFGVMVVVAALAGACSASPSASPPASVAPATSTTSSTTSTSSPTASAGSAPAHVVLVLEENHGFQDVIGSAAAPYINALAGQGALFTQSYALTHPSEPNYLALFSGSSQGVSDDSCPHRFDADNLGHQLLAAGKTFTSYAEDLPSVGYIGCSASNYDSNHNPAASFTDLPASALQPFTSFPADFGTLPTLSFVVPNLNDDMHNGTVAEGDSWLHQHLDAYAQWAQRNNSLLVVTWDEDDSSGDNQIATIFVGSMVQPGQYPEKINHYNLLRTIEQTYGLTPLGHAASAQPITDVWSTGN